MLTTESHGYNSSHSRSSSPSALIKLIKRKSETSSVGKLYSLVHIIINHKNLSKLELIKGLHLPSKWGQVVHNVIKIENFTFHCGPHYLCEKQWFRGRFILLVAQHCNKVNFKLDLAHHCTPQYSENAENVWFLCLLCAIVMGPRPAVNVGSFVNCKMQPLLYIFIHFLSQSVGEILPWQEIEKHF